MRPAYRYLSATAAWLFAAVLLAACGSSSNHGTAVAAGGVGGQSQSSQAGMTAVRAALAPYTGHPSQFPVVEKLAKRPTGATVVYADCGTPICGVFWQLLAPAAKVMGVKLARVAAGTSANGVTSAFESIVQMHPKGVIVVGINLELWSRQLKQLESAGARVVTSGITGTEQAPGLGPQQGGNGFAQTSGKLLADYVAADVSSKATIAFYGVPELPFSPLMEAAFDAQLKTACPDCKARSVGIPVATIGNTAPSAIVSDLQAHPDTNVAVFASDETEAGLPAALRAAGISVKTLGSGPGPTELQYLKDGQESAALGYDLPVSAWTLLDQVSREISGQKITGLELQGIGVQQFLTRRDITFDPSQGWTGYPDFAKRFATLWGVGG